METLKTLKSRTSESLFKLFVISTRNNQLYLRARADNTPYIKSRVNIWSNCIKLIARSEILTTIKISKFKKDLKKTLLKIQNAFNSVEWYPDLTSTLRQCICSRKHKYAAGNTNYTYWHPTSFFCIIIRNTPIPAIMQYNF